MDTDIIIIGGGSAGAAVAHRLSEDPKLQVVLLEAGGSDRHLFSRIPAASALAITSKKLNWMYDVNPDPSRGGRVDSWPAGKVLGGGSSINGMMFVRGNRYDYDLWAKNGASGWSYADVLPYFRRMETNENGADDYRGADGPQAVSQVRIPHRLTDAWVDAAANAGVARNSDLNGKSQEGVGYCQASQKNGWRHSTAQAYISPIKQRPNFQLKLHTFVHRVVIENGRAVGVEYKDASGAMSMLRARRGVVLSAGALASPKILMLSGVGPREHLEEKGLPCLVNQPSVGHNLMEHAGAIMSWHVNIPSVGSSFNPLTNIKHGLDFIFAGRGPLSTSIGHAMALVKTEPEFAAPNVQLIMSPFSYDFNEKGAKLYMKPSIGVAVGLAKADSRGTVMLRSNDPADKPVIDYSLLGAQSEVDQLIAGCRFARQIVSASPFKQYLKDERLPGNAVQSDAQLEDFIRSVAFAMYHVSGTCRMGSDEQAVTDTDLRVRGVDGLWVIDASVIPSLPAGNIHATVIMIGEKGADHIKKALQED